MKLTGQESLVLCLLAEHPKSYAQVVSLLGEEAREVAYYLMGSAPKNEHIRDVGKAFQQWAKDRAERHVRTIVAYDPESVLFGMNRILDLLGMKKQQVPHSEASFRAEFDQLYVKKER